MGAKKVFRVPRRERKSDPDNWGRQEWMSMDMVNKVPLTMCQSRASVVTEWGKRGRPWSLDRGKGTPWNLA